MSIFSLPRIHVRGLIEINVGTANNDDVAVDYGDHSVVPGDPAAATNPFLNATLSFDNRPDASGQTTGIICDVTPEDVPCSQVLAGTLMLARGGNAIFSRAPHKSVTRWINFQRNVNLTASAGAAAAFQRGRLVPSSVDNIMPFVTTISTIARRPNGASVGVATVASGTLYDVYLVRDR